MKQDTINSLLDQIEDAVKFDSFSLTRNDQDAIECRLQQLRNFVNEIYDGHNVKS